MPRTPRKRRWWHLPCYALAVLLVLYVIWIAALNWRLSTELKRLQAADWPTQTQHLIDFYNPDVPDEQNAFLAAQEAWTLYSDFFMDKYYSSYHINDLPIIGRGRFPQPGKPLFDEMRTAIQIYIDANTAEITQLMRLARLTESEIKFDRTDPLGIIMLPYNSIGDSPGHLAVVSAWHLDQGNTHSASLAIQGIINTASIYRTIPSSSHYMRAVALDQYARQATTRLLAAPIPTDTQDLKALLDAFAYAEDPQFLQQALMVDQQLDRALIKSNTIEDYTVFRSPALVYFYVFSGMQLLDQINNIHAFEHATQLLAQEEPIDLAALPIPPPRTHSGGPLPDPDWRFARNHQHAYEMVRIEHRFRAQYRLIRTALAIALYHAQHNQLPATLADLTPAILPEPLTDPYTGQPLRYIKLPADPTHSPNPTGFTLYSVGKNLTDDSADPTLDHALTIPSLPTR